MREDQGKIWKFDFKTCVIQDGKPIPEEVKGMIHHLKKDMEGEIDRLRKHLEKEKNR